MMNGAPAERILPSGLNRSSMDISKLPKHFDTLTAERTWSEYWEAEGIYRCPDQLGSIDRNRLFVIDTPPPTVSGSLHIGHVFSYAHTDVLARFQRMCGKIVVYPMGWDDNGLPTERRVQNYFHVRCNPQLPSNPNLRLPRPEEVDPKSPPLQISRPDFIELCLWLTSEDEKAFKSLWTRVGLSVDWRFEYSTINKRCRAAAQRSFLDLWRKGHIYSVEAPTMWDIDFQTAIAQAEVEDRTIAGQFHRIRFGVEGSDETFTIATTRPELLPACVAVTAHPNDARYRHLFGRRAITPVFRASVPIFPSDLADPEKGTGILMACTFGDANDIRWWREQRLPLRQVLGRDGRLVPVDFSAPNWSSLDPEAANGAYRSLTGKTTKQARHIIVDLLRDPASAADGGPAPLAGEPIPLEHPVKFFEKGDRPLEFIPTRQWFVRLLDQKEKLLELGDLINWHPHFMRHRYRTWTENLAFDWAISRQRYFGVPFPLWYPIGPERQVNYEQPIFAPDDALPLDPFQATPPGYTESQRDQPGGFTAETDVFDTWFTSSLTPLIVSQWGERERSLQSLFPMDLRPQSHEIIRTWAFYTIAKAYLHEGEIPWRHVAISGWIVDPDRKKMSKSRGNVMTPIGLLDEYGSDAVRYWAASAQLGNDTTFDVNVLKVGKRLVTKIFNASKFVLARDYTGGPIVYPMDRVFFRRLQNLVERATAAFEQFQFHVALSETERFFWNSFTDSYIEMARSRTHGALGDEAQQSAISALHRSLDVLLRLFAPFLPFITEEVWSWGFAARKKCPSIHLASWPSNADFADIEPVKDDAIFDIAVQALSAINRGRSEFGVSTAREIESATLVGAPPVFERLLLVKDDVRLAARAQDLKIVQDESLAETETNLEIRDLRFSG
jgi:valyl-tRNA synthetase